MKTIKKGVDGNKFPPTPFLLFSPDAMHPIGGNSIAAGPWWRVPVAHPTRKVTIFFCKEFLRVSWRGDDNPSGPTGQLPLHKGAFFLMFQRDYLVPAGNCLPDKMRKFRHWVQGRWPRWGLRG